MTGRVRPTLLGFFGTLVLATSVGFLGAAFLIPGAAEALLRLFLPALALGYVVTRVYEVQLPRKMANQGYSPFLHPPEDEPPEEAPRVIRERARMLAFLDSPDSSTSLPTLVPLPIRWLLVDEVVRRLAEQRGLHLANPSHHADIRGFVSEATWRLVEASASMPPSLTSNQNASSEPVHLHDLNSIINDLEKL